MKKNSLISVIVPCYNVEKYIEVCLLSIINQTYKNLEIIVIDDGSPDSTPQILEDLSAEYPQIKVIHQKNAGVSAARNTGLKQAKGNYIVFVDGDDYLAPDYMEYMLELVKETGAEFCLSTCWFSKKKEKQTKKEFIKTLGQEEALALLISPDTTVYSVNKIYKRDLLIKHNCFFATDLFYGEGFNFVTAVAQVANCIGVGNRKVYYYRKNNAISATTKFNIKKMYNGIKAIDRIESNLIISTPIINTMLILHRSTFYLGAAVRIKAAGLTDKYGDFYKRCMMYVRQNYIKLAFKTEVSLYRKLMLLGGCISPWLLSKLDIIRRNMISKRSV